jgi:HEAT repeat protein
MLPSTVALLAIVLMGAFGEAAAQEPAAPQAVPAAQLQAAIDKLGDLDYPTRTSAARTVRRTPQSQAVPALLQTVGEHTDGYVRYRALVLLTGFNDPRTKDAMRESLSSPNDRLRAVAYAFFEHSPDPAVVTTLLSALDKEQSEFVRPALIRALAAAAKDPAGSPGRGDVVPVRQALVRDVSRGEDFFRSVVIEALGDYKASYAFDAIATVAKLDGPLQDDAALALGKIGDKRALPTLAGLQRTAPRLAQPSIAAAICLLDVNCPVHEAFIGETLSFADKNPGFQELLRRAAAGLSALAVAGRSESLDRLFSIGIPATDEATRAPVALAVGAVGLRNTTLMLAWLEKAPNQAAALGLLAEGVEMLEEDLDKERFFALTRRMYWGAPEVSPARDLMQTIIGKLDF